MQTTQAIQAEEAAADKRVLEWSILLSFNLCVRVCVRLCGGGAHM